MRRVLVLVGCCLLAACGGDGDTRICFGTDAFCDGAFGHNQEPRAEAGDDRYVAAGDAVELDGGDSSDADGRIDSFSWTQESGPTVTLTGSSHVLATFTAPDVAEATPLDFRLVVTDDDDASDADHVRITVQPADSVALRAGIEHLKTVYRPRMDTAAPSCARCWSFLGLWLGARVRAADLDPDPDALLDELRVIETLVVTPAGQGELAEPARRLLELGQLEVAAFTRVRDPATAELAARAAGRERAAMLTRSDARARDGAPVVDDDAWLAAVAAAYPALGWTTAARQEIRRRARELLGAAPRNTPEATAAATLVLTLAAPAPPGEW